MTDTQVSESTQQVDTPEETEKKLGSLSAVEAVVNQYALKFAKKHRVNENAFTICLVTQFKGVMGLKRGPVVQIILLWPDAQANINTLLEGAFRTIARNRLVDGMAIEPVMHIRKRAEDRRKWLREKLGKDEADIILDLIPKHRIQVQVTTTVEYKDVVTGESLSITHTAKPEQYAGSDVSSWLKLSRQVRLNHPSEATRYADTSELDTARAILSDHVAGEHDASLVGSDASVGGEAGGQGHDEVAGRNDGDEHDAGDTHQIAS